MSFDPSGMAAATIATVGFTTTPAARRRSEDGAKEMHAAIDVRDTAGAAGAPARPDIDRARCYCLTGLPGEALWVPVRVGC